MSDEGRFRPDLYYRLSVFTIPLPPLRERGDDLPMLAQHYIRRFNRDLGREIREISSEALALLSAYSWPGNIRELQSVLKQAFLQATGAVLVPVFLPDHFNHGPEKDAMPKRDAGSGFEAFIQQRLEAGAEDLYGAAHEKLDRILLPLVLQFTDSNQHQAARLLGIARQTLRQKLRDLGLSISHSVQAEENDRD
jgi:two-component system nitrogen regulation response regulator GlnG